MVTIYFILVIKINQSINQLGLSYLQINDGVAYYINIT